MEIDLNADLGEGAGFDAELMPLISSANVCCGLHAGDPGVIWTTLELAKKHGVAVGAHPGYADREHFGRRELAVTGDDVFRSCQYQLGALYALTRILHVELRYVKPHGAMYNQACRDRALACGIIEAAEGFNDLPVVGLPGSEMEKEARDQSYPFIPEGFADRRYRPDGSLVPRTEPDAFVHDPDEAVKQVEWLIREKGVRTICVHGDNPQAVAFTKAVREALLARGFTLKPFA
ncbi:MAG TPA: 5-oxoprolinase subunit PxpA [Gemmataceae bacterium]|nr:5-oxoprolinase subunit PxpA [Gemmataceae bacterium]